MDSKSKTTVPRPSSSGHHYKRKRIMIFDVETTGLIPKQKRGDPEIALELMPHILQISFVIYDTLYWRIVKSYNAHIRVAPEVDISPFISELTGITRKICDEQGVPIQAAMREFYTEYMRCDCIVAHNLEFDREMTRIEMRRIMLQEEEKMQNGNHHSHSFANKYKWHLVFDHVFETEHEIETFCTMRVGRKICNIIRTNSRGNYVKNPKLIELYEHLFEVETADSKRGTLNLHNSLVDTFVCLRCFIKLRFRFNMRTSCFPSMMFSGPVNTSTMLTRSRTVIMRAATSGM